MSAPRLASLPWGGHYSGNRDVPCLLLPFSLEKIGTILFL